MSVKTAALGVVQTVAIQGLMLKERMSTGVAVNVLSRSFRENPYPTYRRLLAKDPVHWSSLGKGWMVTRQSDVMMVLRDPRFAADRSPAMEAAGMKLDEMGPFNRWFSKTVLSLDPPDHTRLRTLASKAFTPRSVEVMRPRIAQIVDDLLDAVQERGSMDIITDLAFPLPVIVIAELLGVPSEDQAMFKGWSDAVGEGLEPIQTAEQIRNADEAVIALSQYFRSIIRKRREQPQDDLISVLVAATEAGDVMNEDELLAMCILLLAAGNETTTNLIGNGMLALLRNPEQLARLSADPLLIDSATEELLRYDSPVQMTGRVAREDVVIGGKSIRKNQQIVTLLGAANHDPEQFSNPEALDVGRTGTRHLGFGYGVHFCLGAPLARVEGQLAINELVRRMPGLRQSGRPEWRPTILLRGLKSLPVMWDRQAAAQLTIPAVAAATA